MPEVEQNSFSTQFNRNSQFPSPRYSEVISVWFNNRVDQSQYFGTYMKMAHVSLISYAHASIK